LPEAKSAANDELSETLARSTVRASLEAEATLLERMAAHAMRPREGAVFVKTSDVDGKTAQVAETSTHVMSGTGKAEASVPTRGVSASNQDFVIELAGRIQAQIRGGREMIRIQLQPEHLGRLEIRAESGRNGIIARIAAESIDAKRLLENNIQNLQQTLEARGLKIDRLHIIVEENSAYAAFADGGRFGHAGAGPRGSEISEFSKVNGTGIESVNEDDPDDLAAAAEQRGVGFYQIG
jgi:flagellar hook-length control protein FliK